MNSNNNLENRNDFTGEIEWNDAPSVDDFIKQLEAKEKDLHIPSDLVIEVDESEYDDAGINEFTPKTFTNRNEVMPVNGFPKAIVPNHKTFSELEDEVSELKSQISKAESEHAELLENSRRRKKDFDNYKSRIERERRETYTNQVCNLATQMLPVLDNLNRALDFAEHNANEKGNEFEQFFRGIILVNQQFDEVLTGMGVSPIASVGERFDPHYHEAVAIEETEDYPPQTVCDELVRGYRVGDRVIRASIVKVSKSRESRIESRE